MNTNYREILTTNDEGMVAHLTKLKPEPIEATQLQGVSFYCTGPTCSKQGEETATPFQLIKIKADGQDPLYSEVWCSRCGAVYLVSWQQGNEPIRVERRGWRNVERTGWYGRLYGHLQEAGKD